MIKGVHIRTVFVSKLGKCYCVRVQVLTSTRTVVPRPIYAYKPQIPVLLTDMCRQVDVYYWPLHLFIPKLAVTTQPNYLADLLVTHTHMHTHNTKLILSLSLSLSLTHTHTHARTRTTQHNTTHTHTHTQHT